MPIEIESLRADLPEGASGTSPGPGAYFSGIARSSKDRREPEILAGRKQRENVPARRREKSRPNTDLAERIQSILALKDLTLYQVSQRSEKLYGRSSPYFLPHNLYFDLRGGTFSPSIYQFFALSRITGYRLPDWVRLFGVDLENIPRLQTSLPSHRTILLDSSLADPYAWIPWFRNRIGDSACASDRAARSVAGAIWPQTTWFPVRKQQSGFPIRKDRIPRRTGFSRSLPGKHRAREPRYSGQTCLSGEWYIQPHIPHRAQ